MWNVVVGILSVLLINWNCHTITVNFCTSAIYHGGVKEHWFNRSVGERTKTPLIHLKSAVMRYSRKSADFSNHRPNYVISRKRWDTENSVLGKESKVFDLFLLQANKDRRKERGLKAAKLSGSCLLLLPLTCPIDAYKTGCENFCKPILSSAQRKHLDLTGMNRCVWQTSFSEPPTAWQHCWHTFFPL